MRPTVFAARPLLALFAGLVLLFASCLNFDKQTIVMMFDPDRDEVHALLVYEDLHPAVNKEKKAELEGAKKALDDLFAQEKGFLLVSPGLMIPVTPPEREEKL